MADSLLLDTHVWLWLEMGDEALTASEWQRIERAGALWISAISIWETAMLAAKGRIKLSGGCRVWVHKALSRSGVAVMPVDEEIAVAAYELPGDLHGDPADRLIVATACAADLKLLTRDHPLRDYARKHCPQVLA